MARKWIKIETVTPDKPEICAIATHLKIDPDAALGKLVRLWAWAEVNRVDGNAVSVTREFIDKVVGQPRFAEALEVAGWLTGSDQALVFTRFSKHNGKAARDRALTAERVTRHREKKRDNDADSVSLSVTRPSVSSVSQNDDSDVKKSDKALITNELVAEKSGVEEMDLANGALVGAVVVEPIMEVETQGLEDRMAPLMNQEAVKGLEGEQLDMANEEENAAAAKIENVTEKKRDDLTGGAKKKVTEESPEQSFLF
jgi:hypothetical protein